MKLRLILNPMILPLVWLAGLQFALAQEAPLTGFDDYVNKAMKDWDVPGVAIAIIKHDRVVLASLGGT